jgi:hypothetical protein
MSPVVIEVLTALLLAVTGFYAYQNRAAVVQARAAVIESREARLQALRPHVVADFWPLGPDYPVIRLTNAGMAVALDVDVTITMDRRSPRPDGSTDPFIFQFAWPAMPVGANHQISPPDRAPGTDRSHLTVLLEEYGPLRMTGTCRDMLGRVHQINQTIDFVAWWSAIGTRNERHRPAPTGEVGQQLHDLNKRLEKIEKQVRLKPGR